MADIKVLIVDDSVVYREMLKDGLSCIEGIEVVATARDPFEAKPKILEFRPNVMVCDIEMPNMNGLDFIRKLLPQYPIPTIMISSAVSAAFDAVDAGAIDFVPKCSSGDFAGRREFVSEVAEKIFIARKSKVVVRKPIVTKKDDVEQNVRNVEKILGKSNIKLSNNNKKIQLIALGASTGGTEALANVLSRLPKELPGIVIVQHIPPVFSQMFAQRINKNTIFDAKEASDGDEIKPGTVLIAPGDKHMRVKKVGSKFVVAVQSGMKVSGHCPSVDVLFQSVADTMGDKAIGVIMTGMGADGARGILEMRRKGARTIGQDKESCIVYGMPKEAYEMGGIEKQASLQDIPKAILDFYK